MCKKRVGVVFGGRSEEHDISCKSAEFVMKALDADKYQPVYIRISKDGGWFECTEDFLIDDLKEKVDFVFPVLHGTYGEDGTIQGLLEMLDIPYAGCGVLASALAMDKALFKDLLRSKGLPTCKSLVFEKTRIREDYETIEKEIDGELGFPCFVKPSNMGSSVGISKVSSKEELKAALRTAAAYDPKVLVEEYIPARELEVAVLGNYIIEASFPGEIIPAGDFYDYDAKYSETQEPSKLIVPAKLPDTTCTELQQLAVKAFEAIGGQGFGRVDFFQSKEDGQIYINEINTIPGLTEKSMFPLLWQAQGKTPGEIIERIIDLGYERYYSKNCR